MSDETTQRPDSRPNVLLVITDQQRSDSMSFAGHPAVHTPNLDAMAGQGTWFRNAYTTHPTCTPSRGAILTGRYPSSHGARMTGMVLPESERTLPAILRDSGYDTASFGKLHFAPMGDYPDSPSREQAPLWRDGARPIECDYYGFDRIINFGGHGWGVYGDYREWLHRKDPSAPAALEALGNLDARLSYPDGQSDMCRFPLPAELHHTSALAEVASDYLREAHSRPFFATVSFSDPHHPFCPPAEYGDKYDPSDMPAPIGADADDFAAWPPHFRGAYRGRIGQFSGGGMDYASVPPETVRRARSLTCGMVELIDVAMGRILGTLDETGLARDTIVVFCADHGDLLGDHGFMYKGPFHWDGVIRVPFIWRCPGRIAQSGSVANVASTLDITPTILDVCGVDQEPGIEGLSVRGFLGGEGGYPRDEALTENDDDYVGERLRTLTTDDWKLTAYAGREYGELYDRRNDPDETRNLWHESNYRAARDEMRLRLLDHVMRSQDRLPVQIWYA